MRPGPRSLRVLAGVFLWALGRVVADLAEAARRGRAWGPADELR